MPKRIHTFAVLFILFKNSLVAYTKTQNINYHQQLDKLNLQIKSLQALIITQAQKKQALSHDICKQKNTITILAQRIKNLDSHRIFQKTAQHQLQQQCASCKIQLTLHGNRLNSLLQVTYMMYHSHTTVILPYCYYLYIIQTRKVSYLQRELRALNQKNKQLSTKLQQSEKILHRYQEEYHKVDRKQKNDQAILNSLYTQLQMRQSNLSQLLENRQALEQLIENLIKQPKKRKEIFSQTTQKMTVKEAMPHTLHRYYGKLLWPVKGQIVRNYHQRIGQSEIRSTGLLIAIEENQEVFAIHKGRVVFAEALRGVGELIIIQHASNILSLYGHNRRLLKKVGETVEAQETIATICARDLLYFEIRYHGKAVDPINWCCAI